MDIFVQFRTTIKIIKLNAQCLEDIQVHALVNWNILFAIQILIVQSCSLMIANTIILTLTNCIAFITKLNVLPEL